MTLDELGHHVRRARALQGLTQQKLAHEAGVSRTTVNLLENGLLRDIGMRKAAAILSRLGLSLNIGAADRAAPVDFLKIASTSASTRSKEGISVEQLRRVFVTGRVRKENRAQIRELLEEAPIELVRGLVRDLQARQLPGKIERNLMRIAEALEIPPSRIRKWMND